MAGSEAEWCGSRKGRRRVTAPPVSTPATLWIMLTSSASRGDRGGSSPGSRCASIDLPEPGGPTINRLCAPAAATSSARLAASCPLMSARSGNGPSSRGAAGSGGVSTCSPLKWLMSASRVGAARISTSPAQAASPPDASGQISPSPAACAPMAAGKRARDRRDRAVQGQLAECRVARHLLARQRLHRDQQAERDRQVEMAAFLQHVGGRQVDRDALRRQAEAERAQRRAHALPALADRLVRQADDGEGGQPVRHRDLHVDHQGIDALKRDSVDVRDQKTTSPEKCNGPIPETIGAFGRAEGIRDADRSAVVTVFLINWCNV